MNGFFQKFRRDIVGIAWLALSLFLGLALFSFQASDPSFNSTGMSLKVQNYCGYIGSFVADMLYQLWGLSAWIIVVGSTKNFVQAFLGKSHKWEKSRLIWAVLLMMTTASLLGLYLPNKRILGEHILIGGLIGTVVSKGLVSAFNFLGVSIILWSMALMLMVFYTERSLRELLKMPFLLSHKGLLKLMSGTFEKLSLVRRFFDLSSLAPQPVAANEASIDKPLFRFSFRRSTLESTSGDEGAMGRSRGEQLQMDLESETEEELEDHEGVEELDIEGIEEELDPPKKRKSLFSRSKKEEPVQRRKVKLQAKIQRRVENWKLPDIHLLEDPPVSRLRLDRNEIDRKGDILVDKLAQFSVRGEVVHAKPGPAVTMYEFKPNADVKISKITELADDLSLALSSESVRIIAPIPGRDVVGIETSNTQRETVYLKDILANKSFWSDGVKLPICLGRQADGESKVVDLRKMPHLMVAGTTGSGKSVFVVSAITGLLFKHSPKSLKLILIDPKQVDLAAFNNIPHLLMPPIREPKKAVSALKWAIREMDKRYRSMSKFGARGLESFNEIVGKLNKEQIEDHEKTNAEWESDARKLEQYYFTPQPYIVIVVEEFGDLMAVDKANVENLVVRLAQMARACGIHLVLAMQSPRKDVVTGLIKTNIPGRISFKVASKMDSRIILDEAGAERLLPNGDMLYLAPGVSKPQRHHAPWITEVEIASIMRTWCEQGEPQYDTLAMRALEGSGGGFDLGGADDGEDFSVDADDEYDERYDEILSYVSAMKEVSASLLQRKFKLGYPRAARMIEIFEREGVVGPANGSKPRQVLVKSFEDR